MKTATRKMTASLTCLVLLLGQMPLANARLGSTRPAQSGAQYQSPARLGSGQSAGMQRPQVMQATRTPPPAAPAPAPVQQAAPAPAAPVAPGPGTPGWVKPALAGAAVGALAGYALSNRDTGNGNGNANGNGNTNANGSNAGFNSNAAGGALAAAPSASGLGGFTGFLLLLVLGSAAFFLWRKYRSGNLLRSPQASYDGQGYNTAGYGSTPPLAPAPLLVNSARGPTNLPVPAGLTPLEAFRSLQDFNSTGNKEALRRVTTPGMFAELESSMGSAPLRILALAASVQDVTEEAQQTVASIRYTGEVTEGINPPEALDEVWHFVLPRSSSNDAWQLAGIEQV